MNTPMVAWVTQSWTKRYLVGDRVHVSGVIAVIACSMYMSRKNPGFMSPQVRLQTTAVWDALTFVLNGIVVVLIGLQLPYVMGQIGGMSRMVLLEYGVGFSHDRGANGVGIWRDLYRLCGAAMGAEGRSGGARATKVVCDRVGRDARSSVTGGGLVAVCTAGWQDVSAEEHVIYLAFCLIVATLVVQGLTLPWLIRRLGLSETGRMNSEEQEARRVLLREALVHLDRKRTKNQDQSAMLGELIASYQGRLDVIPAEREERTQGLVDQARRSEAILTVLQVEREALIGLRDEGRIDDEVLRTLQRELDLEESRVHTGSIVAH